MDRERSTLLIKFNIVNTIYAGGYFAATVGKLSYLHIVLIGHTMVFNIQCISSASISYQDG